MLVLQVQPCAEKLFGKCARACLARSVFIGPGIFYNDRELIKFQC